MNDTWQAVLECGRIYAAFVVVCLVALVVSYVSDLRRERRR